MRSVAKDLAITLFVSFLVFVLSVGYMVWPPKPAFGPESTLAHYVAIAGVVQPLVVLLVLATARFLKTVGDNG